MAQVYQCLVPAPGVAYRGSANHDDKTDRCRGPTASEVVIVEAVDQGPGGVFLRCTSGAGWLPLADQAGSTLYFAHLGSPDSLDLGQLCVCLPECQQPSPSWSPTAELGWEIDPSRLELVEQIGEGNLGQVWRAELTDPAGRVLEVAVKQLPAAVGALDGQFEAELRVLHRASTRCHGVCRMLGVSLKQGKLCLVMKLYSSSLAQLAARLPGRAIPVPRLLGYMLQVSRAMTELHGEGVLVQDLKPANLLWDSKTDAVVVADFGISVLLEGQAGHMMPTSVKGSPNYMAPEQWDPEMHSGVTSKSDVWSFGCSFLELAAGSAPWAGLTMVQIMTAVVNKHQAPAVPETIQPARLRQLLARCMASVPEQRPSFSQLSSEISLIEAEAAECAGSSLEIDRLRAELLQERERREAAERACSLQATAGCIAVNSPTIEPNVDCLFVRALDHRAAKFGSATGLGSVYEAVCASRGRYLLDPQCLMPQMDRPWYVGRVILVGDPAPDGTKMVCASFEQESGEQPGAAQPAAGVGPSPPAQEREELESMSYLKLKKWLLSQGVKRGEADQHISKEALLKLARARGLTSS